MFAKVRIIAEQAGDGALLLHSADELGGYPATVLHSVRAWAAADPDYPLVAERGTDGGWRVVGYGAAVAAADAIGQALIERGLGPARPLLILSGNGVNHLLMTLGALTAGVPVAPVSVAYSLQSRDHARIRAIAELIGPGAAYADDAAAFGPALDALGGVTAITGTAPARRGDHRRPASRRARPRGTRRVRHAHPGRDRQGPVHLRVDGNSQGRAEHAPDAVGEPADDPPGVAVPRRGAPGDRGLAAVVAHVRRQPQREHDARQRRHHLRRRRRRARPVRPDGREPRRGAADHLLQRPRGVRPPRARA